LVFFREVFLRVEDFFLVDVLREEDDEPAVAFERDVPEEARVSDRALVFLLLAFFLVVEAVVFVAAFFLAGVVVALFGSWAFETLAASPLGALSDVGLLGSIVSLGGALAALLLGVVLGAAVLALFFRVAVALRARSRSAAAALLRWRRRTR
jgi:hypothetical protein